MIVKAYQCPSHLLTLGNCRIENCSLHSLQPLTKHLHIPLAEFDQWQAFCVIQLFAHRNLRTFALLDLWWYPHTRLLNLLSGVYSIVFFMVWSLQESLELFQMDSCTLRMELNDLVIPSEALPIASSQLELLQDLFIAFRIYLGLLLQNAQRIDLPFVSSGMTFSFSSFTQGLINRIRCLDYLKFYHLGYSPLCALPF